MQQTQKKNQRSLSCGKGGNDYKKKDAQKDHM